MQQMLQAKVQLDAIIQYVIFLGAEHWRFPFFTSFQFRTSLWIIMYKITYFAFFFRPWDSFDPLPPHYYFRRGRV